MEINFYWQVLAAGGTAILIPLIFTPFLISFSLKRGYTATINHRTSHVQEVPNTGGIILFLAVVIPLFLFSDYRYAPNQELFLSAFVILLITGIIDDLNPLPAGFKFLGQFIPAIVIVTDLEPNTLVIPFLQNIFEVPDFFNHLFWITAIVFVINAFNLIDGIDGLAIGLGLFSSIIFSFLFWTAHKTSLLTFSLILVGGLAGLLRYNLSKKSKIFIGDTGSLLIGGIISYFSLRYLCLEGICDEINRNVTVIAGILFIPAADMLRVILERLVKHQSPFRADRTHLHHLIMAKFHSTHIVTTLIIVISNALLFGAIYLVSQILEANFLPVLLAAFLIYFFSVRLFFSPKTYS